MCTSKSGLQLIINYLHAHFGRPITGIYNCTYGLWFDLLECIIQRDFSFPTDDIRLGYSVSRAVLKLVRPGADLDCRSYSRECHATGSVGSSSWATRRVGSSSRLGW
jgi:hypothetical protein